MTIQELSVRVGADLSDLDDVPGRVDSKLQRVQDRLDSIGKGMTAALTLPIGVIAGAATRAAVQFDNLERGLRAVSASSEEAEAQLAELKEVAQLPGLGLQEAIAGATRLQAAGLSAETATDALRSFGNALATVGAGREELDGVIMALTQIQAKGKVSAEEINQLAERVPQIRRVMEAAFGSADTEELQKMGLTSTQFIEGVIAELGRLPPVSAGIGNAIENMQDTVTIALKTIGDAITPMVEQMISVAVPAVERFTEAFAGMSDFGQRMSVVGAGVVAALGPALYVIPKVISAVTALSGAAKLLPAAFGPVGAAIAAAAAAGYLLYRNWDTVVTFIQDNFGPVLENLGRAWEEVREIAMDAWGSISEIVSQAMISVREVVRSVADDIAEFWDEWGEVISDVAGVYFEQVINVVTTAFRLIADTLGAFADVMQGDWHGLWTRLRNMAGTALEFVGESFINFAEVALSALSVITRGFPPLSRGIDNLRQRLKDITLDLRVEEANVKLKGLQDRVEDLRDEFGDLPVDIATEEARRKLEGLEDALTAFKRRVSRSEMGVDTAETEARIGTVTGKVEALRERLEEGVLGLDNAEATRRLEEITQQSGSLIQTLKNIPLSLDAESAERQLNEVGRLVGGLEERLKNLSINLDETQVRAQVDKIEHAALMLRGTISGLPAVSISEGLEGEVSEFEQATSTLREALDGIPVSVLSEEARGEILTVKKEVAALEEGLQNMPLDLDSEAAKADFEAVRRKGIEVRDLLRRFDLDIATDAFEQKVEESTTAATTKAQGEAKKMGAAYEKILGDVARDVSVSEGIAELFGGRFTAAAEKVDIMRSAVEKLLKEGFRPSSKEVQNLVAELDKAKARLQAMAPSGPVAVAGLEVPTPEEEQTGLNDMVANVELVGVDQFEDAAGRVLDASDALEMGLEDAFGNMAMAVGESIFQLASGASTMGDVLGTIGRTVITSLAAIAERVGKLMIGFGVAGKALQNLVMNPIGAIVAGSALLVLAGAARAAVSKAVSGDTGGAGGGAYAQPVIDESTVFQPTGGGQGGRTGQGRQAGAKEIDVNLSVEGTSLAGRDVLFTVEKTEDSYKRQGTARE